MGWFPPPPQLTNILIKHKTSRLKKLARLSLTFGIFLLTEVYGIKKITGTVNEC